MLALWHPGCVGAKGKQHQETGKISHVLPEQTRTNHGHSCFLLRPQSGQSRVPGTYLSLLSLILHHCSQTKNIMKPFSFLSLLLFLSLPLPDYNQQLDSDTGKNSVRTCKGNQSLVFSCSSLLQTAAFYMTTLVIPTVVSHHLRQKPASQICGGKKG